MPAFAAVLVFHTCTRALFPIGMFSAIMVLSAMVYFEPSWPRALWARLGTWTGIAAASPRATPLAAPPWSPLARSVASAFVLLQLALPFRYLAYDGSVLWHEQGMRLSWRVMVREKNGSVTYVVTDPRTRRSWQVPARRYLTSIQERELGGQPDLILQLAHHVRDVESARVGARVEVRAETLVSLNGRRARPLVDPTVDLAEVEDGWGPATWITPSPVDAPPVLRAVGTH